MSHHGNAAHGAMILRRRAEEVQAQADRARDAFRIIAAAVDILRAVGGDDAYWDMAAAMIDSAADVQAAIERRADEAGVRDRIAFDLSCLEPHRAWVATESERRRRRFPSGMQSQAAAPVDLAAIAHSILSARTAE